MLLPSWNVLLTTRSSETHLLAGSDPRDHLGLPFSAEFTVSEALRESWVDAAPIVGVQTGLWNCAQPCQPVQER